MSGPVEIPFETAAFLDRARQADDVTELRLTVFGGDAAIAESAIDSYLSAGATVVPKARAPEVLPAGSCGGSSTDPPVRVVGPTPWTGHPTWSPDCTHLVYSELGVLWKADIDGSNRTRLYSLSRFGPRATSGFDFWDVAWSPDGQRIAFIVVDHAARPRVAHLHIIGVDGRGHRQLTDGSALDSSPNWSPDGNRIAFIREIGASVWPHGDHRHGENAILVIDVETRAIETRVPANTYGAILHLRWSPDGSKFAFAKSSAVWSIDADGSSLQQLFTLRPSRTGKTASQALSWSPDGRHIAFVGGPGISKRVITIINADGSGHRTLEGPSGSISDPAWSPDGQRIAYVKSSIAQIEDHRYSVWNYEIWMVGADSGVTAAE